MILAIDIGNTNIVLGAVTNGNIDFMARISTDKLKTEDEYGAQILSIMNLYHIDVNHFEGGIISSVVPPVLNCIKKAITRLIGKEPMVVGPGVKTGLNILMDNPATVGSDMIVCAVAALEQYKPPVMIVDMGTATTISVVDKNRNYIGGCIMPGVNVSLEAISNKTAQLPHISLEKPKSAIGKNTIDCMRSGVLYGNAAMIEGCIERMEEEIGQKTNVVVTGGLGKNIAALCKRQFDYDPELLIKGMYIIYKKNSQK